MKRMNVRWASHFRLSTLILVLLFQLFSVLQLLMQSYSAGFNHANRNSSSEQGKKASLKQLLLIAGAVSYTTCAGALPQIVINRLHISSTPIQTFLRFILPVPLSAALAFFNVFVVRSEESETGIRVFDSNGNPVGLSKAAGEKAVRETALSRAALFGTTTAVPNLLLFLSQRSDTFKSSPIYMDKVAPVKTLTEIFPYRRRLLQGHSLLLSPLWHMSAAFVLIVMIPVSFSLFPQLGTIKKENIEEELQAAAESGQLYYHRGL